MLADEIKNGESTNMEFKVEIPQKSEKYIKTVVAFANTSGGKIIIGVDDSTHEIVGVDRNAVFKLMDSITNTISDMCCPQIFPNIGFDTIEGKCVIVIEIYPGANRPYYIKKLGKENGIFIRVAGTSRPADEAIAKDLELQGLNKSFDEIICVEEKYDEQLALKLCTDIKHDRGCGIRIRQEESQGCNSSKFGELGCAKRDRRSPVSYECVYYTDKKHIPIYKNTMCVV